MTAFGRARNTSADGSKDITAEIKSVNSRYMDCTVKLPRMYSFLEERIKAYLTSRGIQRGKVEIYIGVDVLEQAGSEVYLDRAAAASYIAALEALRDEFNLRDDISVMRVAGNRELFSMRKPEDDAERDWEDVKSVLSPAVDAFLERREAEGARLMEDIYSKIEGIKAITVKIAEISANDIQGYGAKLEERIKKFLADFDVEISEQRILTEAAVFADKAAIDEELVRLSSHFETFREKAGLPSSGNEPRNKHYRFKMLKC